MSSEDKRSQVQASEQEQLFPSAASVPAAPQTDITNTPMRGAHVAPHARPTEGAHASAGSHMHPGAGVAPDVRGEVAPRRGEDLGEWHDLDEVAKTQDAPAETVAPAQAPVRSVTPEPEPAKDPTPAAKPVVRPVSAPQGALAPRQAPIPASEAVNAPGRNEMPVENRTNSDTATGSNDHLSWGARSDVGLVREHNEDAFLVKAPLFAVCDGMGGHAAGEVASDIAVRTIANHAPAHADEILLGAAVETANAAVLEGSNNGTGKPGMGCTATCVYIENNRMSVAHVGDSRVYLLHGGTLVRITHDHSYVEELVDAGEITADEARVHPSRSIITRALGSDPDMYADHFTLDVSSGDRVILCSDGLSSMVSDKDIEELAVSSVTPQAAADTLVSAALTAGGHDNVTVVVVDVEEDGVANIRRLQRIHGIQAWFVVVLLAFLATAGVVVGIVHNSWYVGNNDGTVGIYRGISDEFFGIELGNLVETSSVQVSDLPEAVQHQLDDGISVADEAEARHTVERYRDQIDSDKTHAAQVAQATQSAANVSQQDAAGGEAQEGATAEEQVAEEQAVQEGVGTDG